MNSAVFPFICKEDRESRESSGLDEAFYWTKPKVVFCKGTKGVHLKKSCFILDKKILKTDRERNVAADPESTPPLL